MSMPSRISAALADHYRLEEEIGAGGMATGGVFLDQNYSVSRDGRNLFMLRR